MEICNSQSTNEKDNYFTIFVQQYNNKHVWTVYNIYQFQASYDGFQVSVINISNKIK